MCIRDRQGPPTSLGESPRAEKANNKSDSAGRLLTLSFRDLPQGRDLTRKSHHSQPSPKPTPNTIDLRYCGATAYLEPAQARISSSVVAVMVLGPVFPIVVKTAASITPSRSARIIRAVTAPPYWNPSDLRPDRAIPVLS